MNVSPLDIFPKMTDNKNIKNGQKGDRFACSN